LAKKAKKETPLMKQYKGIKAKYPDALLLFRVGDFYETFGTDAVTTAAILDIILTKKAAGTEGETELAGFPYHALNTYLPKLVKAGHRVAICDQLEDPKQTKTIVKRGVTELITPGLALNDDILNSKSNNFLASLYFDTANIGIAFLDISTGEFLVSQGDTEYIDKLLQNFNPSEVIISKDSKRLFESDFQFSGHIYSLENWIFQADYANETLIKHFQVSSLKGFGIHDLYEGVIASGGILHYLSETQHHHLKHISSIRRIEKGAYVWMDRFTIRNLELYTSPHERATTLLKVIDYSKTSMGSRLLKRWLAFPLKEASEITQRHEVVQCFREDVQLRTYVSSELQKIGDLERLISKVATGKIQPRELIQLKNSLEVLTPLKQKLLKCSNITINELASGINECEPLRQRIKRTLFEDAPVHLQKGGVIADGFSPELDELRNLSRSGKSYLEELVKRESEATGIPSLKIASNNVFGYYLEVRTTHKDKVPEEWIRKQTLVNAERYITEELKDYEAKILGAEEQIGVLEQSIYEELILWLQQFITPVQSNALIIAQIDVLCGFAQLATKHNYCRPVINDSYAIDIKEGRHPVIEQQLPLGESYIANDLYLDKDQQQMIMITGPNMSGKSAILRQTALIVLLAQIGSFVPAKAANIGLVDKIFTRVGASDNISMGESTFMVEMNETASILNNVSDRSLVLLDEIGRGTSTYDGISIAWAISEYLHEHPARAKTLFATHYHELNEMTNSFERIKNYNVSIKELKDNVLFLRKLEPGGSEHSFGIHVAKMAGMPQQVISRASKVLKRLEQSHGNGEVKDQIKSLNSDLQLSFFQLDDPLLDSIKDEIVNTDINTLTPVEALMKLNEINRMLVKKKQA
jgi:DNA mismatch repair protein MutS